ncbi:hypothetical protein [Labrys monachus]|uniref:Uncharacterized protein n=1 Tax=Labrys monachus TaxID=217067 RepID=A0ABU0FC14_9HYPH|nr:hypothetical protein [Labrys monachus]MDQ0392154.1 hypothetical protein [Labrys monachus]
MTSPFIDRRALLALGAGLALSGCATSLAGNAALPVIRSVRVTGHANSYIERITPYVQRNLVQQLGSRYQPGAAGGATLVVELTGIELETASGDSFGPFSSDASDVLDSRITLLSPSGAAVKSFPLLTSTFAVDASDQIPDPTPRRFNSLARTFSYWVVSKLG